MKASEALREDLVDCFLHTNFRPLDDIKCNPANVMIPRRTGNAALVLAGWAGGLKAEAQNPNDSVIGKLGHVCLYLPLGIIYLPRGMPGRHLQAGERHLKT